MRRRRAFAALVLVAGTLGATSVSNVRVADPLPAAAKPALATTPAPAGVLVRYTSSLATLRRPKTLSFEYAVSQLGLHTMEQTHRVYRSGKSERDEMLAADGYVLPQSSVRIFKNRIDRYDVGIVSPRPDAYAFAFTRAVRRSNAVTYVFATTRRSAAAFAVHSIEIDGRTFLPTLIRFRVASGDVSGDGQFFYGHSERYWVIREARVKVKLKDGTDARERIVWTKYRFSTSLPRSTFELSRPRATATPSGGEVLPPAPQLPPPGA